LSWHDTEPGKDEGNMQLPTMADARMDYKAPIAPKDAAKAARPAPAKRKPRKPTKPVQL
jgi:hypothetical protein